MCKVFPSFVEVNLTFECPNCSTTYYFIQEEIPLNVGKKWYCGCGTPLVLCRKKDYNEYAKNPQSSQKTMDKPNITGRTSPSLDTLDEILDFSQNNQNNQCNQHNQLAMECITIMVDMGFSKNAVESKINIRPKNNYEFTTKFS
jgi:hypothetical protein